MQHSEDVSAGDGRDDGVEQQLELLGVVPGRGQLSAAVPYGQGQPERAPLPPLIVAQFRRSRHPRWERGPPEGHVSCGRSGSFDGHAAACLLLPALSRVQARASPRSR